jgi:hypothetical protein
MARKVVPEFRSHEGHVRIEDLEVFQQRAVANHELRSRQVETQEVFDALLDSDTPDIEEHGAGQVEPGAVARTEAFGVHTA